MGRRHKEPRMKRPKDSQRVIILDRPTKKAVREAAAYQDAVLIDRAIAELTAEQLREVIRVSGLWPTNSVFTREHVSFLQLRIAVRLAALASAEPE